VENCLQYDDALAKMCNRARQLIAERGFVDYVCEVKGRNHKAIHAELNYDDDNGGKVTEHFQ
jgi:hypothetical protein